MRDPFKTPFFLPCSLVFPLINPATEEIQTVYYFSALTICELKSKNYKVKKAEKAGFLSFPQFFLLLTKAKTHFRAIYITSEKLKVKKEKEGREKG
jgi:hypothetical protein